MDLKAMFPRASKSFLDANNIIASSSDSSANGSEQQIKKIRVPKGMNKTETDFSHILEAQKRRGEILTYTYEGVTLSIGIGCKFTPDFFVVVSHDPLRLRCCETKGRHIWDDAKVKYRVARSIHSWAEWQLWQKVGGQWSMIE
jgi:hypothetical protein